MSAKSLYTVLALSLAGLASAAGVAVLTGPQEMPPAEKPTAHHEMIVKGAGMWEGTLTYSAPGAPEMEVPCHEHVTVLGDFWVQSQFHCDMGPGMSFHGSATMGYDALAKEAVGTWIDDSRSYMAVMRGTIDPKAGSYEMKWRGPAVEQGNKIVDHRSVTTLGDNTSEMKFFMDMGGEEVHFMTIAMKRMKADGHDHGGEHGHEGHDADHGKKKGGR